MSDRSDLPIHKLFLAVARDYIGIREIGGDNRGPSVEFMQKLGEITPGLPWCAAYVNAVAEIACSVKNIISPFEAIDYQGYVQSYFLHAQAENWLGAAHPGDIGMIYYPTKSRYAHIFIVDAVLEEGVTTIEGNTNDDGSRNGVGVFQRFRTVTDRIVFANPWGNS